jgi:serine/threonine-protein kinase HipA
MPPKTVENAGEDYSLQVFSGRDLVGLLRFDPESDAFSFDYAPQWSARADAFQLSPHIPFDLPASAVTVRRFIQNLLPEGQALDVAASYSNVSKGNVFGLIHALGAESAGALRFLPMAKTPPTEAVRRQVSFRELQERIDERDRRPFIVWDGKVRISIAGYQDKLQVVRQGDELYLVDGALSSTHILKPPSRNPFLPHMVVNEHFCMQLVNRIGQQRMKQDLAARVDILRVPSPVLCVERFDRRLEQGQVSSIHILDGCQALDRPVEHKYERNVGTGEDVRQIRDGVSFEALGALRRQGHLANAAVDLRQIAMWSITTLLLGNSDAHGKNLSFFARSRSLAVAPFYDLVCTALYDGTRIEHDLAMAFGDVFGLEQIKSFALADFCERLGWPRATFARELRTLCRLARQESQAQADSPVYTAEERTFLKQLADYIGARADALEGMAGDIPKFAADNFTGG